MRGMQVLKSFLSWEGRASKWVAQRTYLKFGSLRFPFPFGEGAEHEADRRGRAMRPSMMGDYWHGLLGLG